GARAAKHDDHCVKTACARSKHGGIPSEFERSRSPTKAHGDRSSPSSHTFQGMDLGVKRTLVLPESNQRPVEVKASAQRCQWVSSASPRTGPHRFLDRQAQESDAHQAPSDIPLRSAQIVSKNLFSPPRIAEAKARGPDAST